MQTVTTVIYKSSLALLLTDIGATEQNLILSIYIKGKFSHSYPQLFTSCDHAINFLNKETDYNFICLTWVDFNFQQLSNLS